MIAEWTLGKPKAQIARELGVSRSYVRNLTRNLNAPLVTAEQQVDLGALVSDLIAELARGATALGVRIVRITLPVATVVTKKGNDCGRAKPRKTGRLRRATPGGC